MNFNELKCQYEDCGLILENPVTLLCGHTLCKQHLLCLQIFETKFKCFFCNKQHSIPEEGFCINITIDKMIDKFYQTDPSRKEIKNSLDSFNELINKNATFSPNVFIYDYFADIRKKVDLHRKNLIKKINEKSDEIFKILNDKEANCKLNNVKVEMNGQLPIDELVIWKNKLRSLNPDEINDLQKNINSKIQIIKNETKNRKNLLLFNESIEFNKFETNYLFGELKIKKNNQLVLSNDDGKLIKTYKHSKCINSIQADENSNRLISCSDDNTIKIWNLKSGRCLKTLNNHKNWVTSILLIPNNIFISGSYDKTIKIWRLNSYKCLKTLKNDSEVESLCLISANQIACGCGDGSINIWNLYNSIKIKSFKAHDDWICYYMMVIN